VKPRVSILCHTLSGNALGRAWVFYELLRDAFELELVVSARRTDRVWPPLEQSGLCPKRWFVRTLPGFRLRVGELARELVTGDLIIAIKPRLHSFGLALEAKRQRPRPLLLDIDDWELGFFSGWADALCAPVSWVSAASNLYTRWYFTRTHCADAITVTSTFLAQRFGGTWLPHARAEQPRPSIGLAAQPLVMFIGTPRRHKGLADLVEAFGAVRTPGAELCIIGGAQDRGLSALAERDRRIRLEPSVSMESLPARLGQAWLVAIPQRDEAVSRAQLPAKLMDAMALGKAIVSTDVGDIPDWLANDCGVIVPPGDPQRLGAAIDDLLGDPARRDRLGENARARFAERGSERAVRPRLHQLVEALLAGESRAHLPPAPDQAAVRRLEGT
jgi:glycosyltransferase involved in cell wall biosynthesis